MGEAAEVPLLLFFRPKRAEDEIGTVAAGASAAAALGFAAAVLGTAAWQRPPAAAGSAAVAAAARWPPSPPPPLSWLTHSLFFSQNVRNQNYAPPLRLARSDAAMQIFSFSPPLLCNYYCALLPTVFSLSLFPPYFCVPFRAALSGGMKQRKEEGGGGGRAHTLIALLRSIHKRRWVRMDTIGYCACA